MFIMQSNSTKKRQILPNIWLIVAFIFLLVGTPILLDFILSRNNPIPQIPIVGDSKDWLTFWGAYIGALASFVMVVVAYKTLKNNSDQLKELKRQWEERNTPYLSCALSVYDGVLVIEIVNSSDIHAKNVKCKIENHTQRIKDDFSQLNSALERMSLEIPPHYVKRIKIYGIEPYASANYGDDYISVKLLYENNTQQFDLYLQEITIMTWQYSQNKIIDELDDIKKELKSIRQ